ncbi:MAG: MBL fold metallo-hydrolase [Candidatus Mycalebacterium zealandia]|nr:MAG: MBL fold metallo-hydrolase [Candidatus Mycalebacterium zealandia]
MKAKIIDHNFISPNVIASYLLDSSDGAILIESGPSTTFASVEKGLAEHGVRPEDIRHVFVTHIHLDHSGGAWRYARNGAKVYVHPKGAEHLTAPERLVSSAARVFGDRMETLWGDVQPVADDMVTVVEDGETISVGDLKIRAFDTPGHAGHHHCYLVDGTLFTGDAAGVRIDSGAVIPPTPPPEINIELWQGTVEKIREISPDSLCPTHFGRHTDVSAHLDNMSETLDEFSSWVGARVEKGEDESEIVRDFQKKIEDRVTSVRDEPVLLDAYRNTDTVGMNTGGLVRYWKKFRMAE